MAEYLSWSRIFEAGGPALIVLIICSIISFVVIIERLIYYQARSASARQMADEFIRVQNARDSITPEMTRTPMGYVLAECLQADETADVERREREFEEIKGRAIAEKIPEMERYLNIEATLGTVSPYIGLLGTVLGIIRAFTGLGSGTEAGDPGAMNELNRGIAEALIATAAGLFVAIPATMAYNYFRRRVNNMILEIEVAASRLKNALLRARR